MPHHLVSAASVRNGIDIPSVSKASVKIEHV